MKTSQSLLLALVCCVAPLAKAGEYTSVTLHADGGQRWTFDATSLTLRPDGNNLIVTPTAGEAVTIPLATLTSLEFGNDASAWAPITEAAESPVTVFNLHGVMLGTYTSRQAATQALPKGVYVIKSEVETSKLIIR